MISVVVVAHNSRSDLERCLPSLYDQDVSHEIIVVDNCSTDGTVPWLRQAHPHVRVIALRENVGYAAGNNVGIRRARGRFVLVLNPDTLAHPGAMTELRQVAVDHPRAFVNPKLLQQDGSLNTCGNDMHFTGITTCTGVGEDPEKYRGVRRPFLLSGAAILAPKDAWLDVGGFDERYFLYMEDTDLSLRARLKGYEILCAADAQVTHRYRLNMSPVKFYYLERNRLLTLLKTYQAGTLRHAFTALLLTEVATWAYAAVQGPAYIAARWRGYVWIWHRRRDWSRERSVVQETRVVSDAPLLSHMLVSLPYEQLIGQPRLARLLDRTTTPLYRWARP